MSRYVWAWAVEGKAGRRVVASKRVAVAPREVGALVLLLLEGQV